MPRSWSTNRALRYVNRFSWPAWACLLLCLIVPAIECVPHRYWENKEDWMFPTVDKMFPKVDWMFPKIDWIFPYVPHSYLEEMRGRRKQPTRRCFLLWTECSLKWTECSLKWTECSLKWTECSLFTTQILGRKCAAAANSPPGAGHARRPIGMCPNSVFIRWHVTETISSWLCNDRMLSENN
jgi:hypothetical protein